VCAFAQRYGDLLLFGPSLRKFASAGAALPLTTT